MDIGQTITTIDNRVFRITDVAFANEVSYREVYIVEGPNPNGIDTARYKLVVYDPKRLANTRYKKMPDREDSLAHYLSKYNYFDTLYDRIIDASTDSGHQVRVLIYNCELHSISLRRYLVEHSPSDQARWHLISMVIEAMNQVRVEIGGHHFNVSPDSVRVCLNDEGELANVLIDNLQSISDDYDLDQDIDAQFFDPAYRALETYTIPFSPKSVQFTLAAFIAYVLQGCNPWGIDVDDSDNVVAGKMRAGQPVLDVADEVLAAVLRRALSIKPSARFDTFNDFIYHLPIKFPLPGSTPSLYDDPNDQPKPAKAVPPAVEGGDNFATADDAETVTTETAAEAPEIEDTDPIDHEFEDKFGSYDDRNPHIRVEISRRCGPGFKDVAGMEVIKEQLKRDFVDIYKHREMAAKYNLRIPACILFGPPGCGKTYLAQKLAEEMQVDFATINPSDFANIYIHGSQMLIRQFFDKAVERAEKSGGVLVFMDEVDSICPLRSDSQTGQSGEVAEMLTLLNDLAKKNVWVVAATNSLDRVDPAILRAGRIDKAIYVPMPDAESRKQLFAYELAKVPHDQDIDLDQLSSLTDGHTSSDISYIVNECARIKFAEVVDLKCEDPIMIDQAVVEKVISETRPSVTKADLARYEDMRQRYATTRNPRRALGFQP